MGILLSWRNLVDDPATVLSVSSEAPGLGLRNVLTPQVAEVWRSGAWGASFVTMDADLGAVRQINLIAFAAPRDGRLPGASATVQVQASAQAPLSAANLQPDGSSIAPTGGNFVITGAVTDLGAVPGPTGAAGARRLGSTAANGAGVWIGRTPRLSVVGGALYRLSLWARSVGAPTTRGSLLTTDEFTVSVGGVSQRRVTGPAMVGNLDSQWRLFTRTFAPLSTTTHAQVFFAEAWTAGAEIEVADVSIRRIGDALDLDAQPFGLSPLGVWAWASTAPISARYLRWTFAGGAADAYLQLGRVWAGPALITLRPAAYGHAMAASDPGFGGRAGLSGLRVAQRGTAFRAMRFSAPTLTSAEAAQVHEAALAVGTTGQVFAARHHLDLAGTGMFGAFTGAPPAPERVAHNLWRADFAIEEDL